MLVDIVRPASVGTLLYFLRALFAVLAIIVAYGLSKKESWSAWLYGFMVIISFMISPLLAILPAAVVLFLIVRRKELKASFVEAFFRKCFGRFHRALAKLRGASRASPGRA